MNEKGSILNSLNITIMKKPSCIIKVGSVLRIYLFM